MNLSQNELLSQLREMNEYEFEELVADVWEQRGWQTTVTTGSSDRGIDVIAQKSSPFSQKHLIQAKRYSAGNKIGSPDIQQYSSLRQQEDDVDAVVIVTTSSFSSQAKQTAKDLNVKLITGEELSRIILELDSQESLSNYFQTNVEATENRVTNTKIPNSNTTSSKNGRENNSLSPFNSDSGETTRSHKYFSKCPICKKKYSIWLKNDDSVSLKCSNCETTWCKAGGLLRTKWEVQSGENEGEKKSTKQWKKEAKWKNINEDTNDYISHPFDSESVNPTRDHTLFSNCPMCGKKNSIWFEQEKSKKLKCSNCETVWMKVSGLVLTKWKVHKGRNKGEKKSEKEWEKEAKSKSNTKDYRGIQ